MDTNCEKSVLWFRQNLDFVIKAMLSCYDKNPKNLLLKCTKEAKDMILQCCQDIVNIDDNGILYVHGVETRESNEALPHGIAVVKKESV